MILVTFAVPFESAAFRQTEAARQVRIVHTGVGAEAARVALELAVCAELPDRVVAAGFAGALVPDLAIGKIVSDRDWKFASAGEVLATAATKAAFRTETGADVVDMESDAIREVCRAAAVPCRVVRAISDRADDDLGLPPDLLAALTKSPVSSAPRLGWTLLTDGHRRRSFLRLVRDCRTAQQALARALEREVGNGSRSDEES